MKEYSSIKSLLLAGSLAILLATGSCTEDGAADPEPNGEPQDTAKVDDPPIGNDTPNANEISSGLLLDNATVHSGEIPAISPTADLKIDKDTLFLTEGIKNRIRILKPDGLAQAIPSILIQVQGAEEFFEIIPEEEETTDSTLVFYMEFDPDPVKDDIPLSFEIKIVPKDEDDNGVDKFTKVVVVEEKNADSCSPLNPYPNWVWIWTTTAGVVTAAPGMPVGTVASTNGCCMEGYSVDCIANAIPEEEWLSLSYAAYSMANFEYISFSDDGSFIGGLTEQTQNLDYSESDFCVGVAAYIRNTRDNNFWGNF